MLSLAKESGEHRGGDPDLLRARFEVGRSGAQRSSTASRSQIVYEDGKLDYVAARDRDRRRLVTDEARWVIPELPKTIRFKGRIEVRGEALMPRSTWQAYNDTHRDRR